MKDELKMNAEVVQRLTAICSWAEVHAPKVAEQLTESFYDNLDMQVEKLEKDRVPPKEIDDLALSVVKEQLDATCYSFLSTGERRSQIKKEVGFGYCMQISEQNTLLREAVETVKQNGLLKESLALLETSDLPLTEDEKIIMLLQSPNVVPPHHYFVKGKVSVPVVDAQTQQKKTIRLPVKVLVAGNEVKEILLAPSQNQHE